LTIYQSPAIVKILPIKAGGPERVLPTPSPALIINLTQTG
jgi:hypothetical protein